SSPPLESLISDVYADITPALQRQFDQLKRHIRRYPEAYPRGAKSLDLDVGMDTDSQGEA
ncbi:MAG TPA: thiamine pyrophosphate-dependent dehydrogenase E1 component subunit alpha, partial [Halomonas sp.]|nr:thiamine pyrophosphate-dependent dehydrogenase E1 component subunit alpha [Halomonas sp.]